MAGPCSWAGDAGCRERTRGVAQFKKTQYTVELAGVAGTGTEFSVLRATCRGHMQCTGRALFAPFYPGSTQEHALGA